MTVLQVELSTTLRTLALPASKIRPRRCPVDPLGAWLHHLHTGKLSSAAGLKLKAREASQDRGQVCQGLLNNLLADLKVYASAWLMTVSDMTVSSICF